MRDAILDMEPNSYAFRRLRGRTYCGSHVTGNNRRMADRQRDHRAHVIIAHKAQQIVAEVALSKQTKLRNCLPIR